MSGRNIILKDKQGNQVFPATTAEQVAWNDRVNLKQAIAEKLGAPMSASTVSSMTDKTRIYVYTGDESGYTKGNWYYWDGSAWVSGGVYNSTAVDTDKTLSVSDKPADGEVVGREISELKDDLSQLSEEMANITGIGLSAESIDKLEEVGNYLAYTTADGGSKWTELIAILRGTSGGEEPENPEVTLTSISASYYGGDVAVGTLLNDLTGITVTAHYSNGSTANVTDYTLSGEIAEGINTITVSYGGKTTTFTVVGYVEEEPDTPPTDNTEPVYQLESPYDLASNGKTDTGFAPFATEEPYNKAFTICCTATATRVSGSITQIFDLSLNNISLLGFMYDGWYWGVPWFGGKGRPLNSEGANITGNTITDYKLIITHEANSNDIVTRYITSDNKVTTTATNFDGLKSVFEETITIGDGNTGWGSGSIDDFKWYNRVLSDEEITAYFEGV